MPKLKIFSLCTLSLSAACGDDPTPPTTEITISTASAPAAIAYRDGIDGEWQAPTPSTTGSYKLDVHGPYIVSVVCSTADGSLVTMKQIARTPEDGRALDLACPEAPRSTSDVTGAMVQPGAVHFGAASKSSTTPDWEFTLASPAGTFDLIGISGEAIAIRRDIAVTGPVTLEALDLEQEGAALVPVALTASNAASGEELEAEVAISTPKTPAGQVHVGAPADAKIAPTSLLVDGVRQSVAMIASREGASRMVRRDFKSGDPTAFALPEALAPVQLDTASGDLVATWTTLPEHDRLLLAVHGTTADGKARELELELSQRFAAATGATSATLDTDLPGHQAAWRPDFSREHLRELSVVRDREGVHTASSISKLVNAQP